MPARVILQDFTGVPCVVDLAAMRDAIAELGGDPSRINPLVPADLVIDHSVQVDQFGSDAAFLINVEREYERNGERYALLRWAQQAFADFRVVPPGTGIVHQVNLEFLADVVAERDGVLVPDTLVGTDSHTTMINGLGVLGWGVGGIEAEAALLGQPLYQPMPIVVGFRLDGEMPSGSTATDLVLVVTEMLRAHGVVGKFVEFYGPGLTRLGLADRATISNMSPEFGATATMFPIDDETLRYLRMTGRTDEVIARVEAYAKAQGLFRTDDSPEPAFSESLSLDLSTVVPSLAGPKRPQDRVALSDLRDSFRAAFPDGLHSHADGTTHEHHAAGRGRGARHPRRGQRRVLPGVGPAVVYPRPGGGAPREPGCAAARAGAAAGRRALPRGRGPPGRSAPQDSDRIGRHRGDHVVHEHEQPDGHGRRRPAGAERGGPRPRDAALGEDLAGARIPGGDRLPARGRPDGSAREAAVPPRRLRLHDLHRQLRAAGRAGRGGHRGERHRRGGGPVGQPQLRGTDPSTRAGELPRVAAARRRLRAGRTDRHRHDLRADRDGSRRQAGHARRDLAAGGRDRQRGPEVGERRGLLAQLRIGLRRGRPMAGPAGAGRGPIRLGPVLDVRGAAAVLRRAHRRALRPATTSSVRARWRCSATA